MTGRELLDKLTRFGDEQLSYEILIPDGTGDLRQFRNKEVLAVCPHKCIVMPLLDNKPSIC